MHLQRHIINLDTRAPSRSVLIARQVNGVRRVQTPDTRAPRFAACKLIPRMHKDVNALRYRAFHGIFAVNGGYVSVAYVNRVKFPSPFVPSVSLSLSRLQRRLYPRALHRSLLYSLWRSLKPSYRCYLNNNIVLRRRYAPSRK